MSYDNGEFNTEDVEIETEGQPTEESNFNEENLFNNSQSSDGGTPNGNKPRKKANIKIVGFVLSGFFIILLVLVLNLGKYRIVKEDSNSIIQVSSETQVVEESTYIEEEQTSSTSVEKEVNSEEKTVNSTESKLNNQENKTTSNESAFNMEKSHDTIVANSFETMGEIKDVSLYEDTSLNTAQYLVTILFIDENDKEDYTVYMTSSKSAEKLKIGTLVDISYQRTAKNGNVILSTISISEENK